MGQSEPSAPNACISALAHVLTAGATSRRSERRSGIVGGTTESSAGGRGRRHGPPAPRATLMPNTFTVPFCVLVKSSSVIFTRSPASSAAALTARLSDTCPQVMLTRSPAGKSVRCPALLNEAAASVSSTVSSGQVPPLKSVPPRSAYSSTLPVTC